VGRLGLRLNRQQRHTSQAESASHESDSGVGIHGLCLDHHPCQVPLRPSTPAIAERRTESYVALPFLAEIYSESAPVLVTELSTGELPGPGPGHRGDSDRNSDSDLSFGRSYRVERTSSSAARPATVPGPDSGHWSPSLERARMFLRLVPMREPEVHDTSSHDAVALAARHGMNDSGS
jgi:hypothetical protein